MSNRPKIIIDQDGNEVARTTEHKGRLVSLLVRSFSGSYMSLKRDSDDIMKVSRNKQSLESIIDPNNETTKDSPPR